ncbi:DUF2973 domain-containing protein [Synechococcus elongatus]|uniref:Uncharacterized protein SEM0011 n=2 Tax=Synechococcus elongatus TaxID=32046 RepID=Q8GJM8_SYNE7|nr:DUF2973 domain-containing protein [Synechococcus elongatus]AAN46161.1 unknown protein [Synechococcus elongatus PCC 7942 = FACHB-805]WKW06935.1 DUF2973 domain-containing protein [Synechococcus elongatus PCC 7942 = FACHB-805]BAD80448.1 hypothetical protein syc2258_d [Synechococcus elongatus PCC 6301]
MPEQTGGLVVLQAIYILLFAVLAILAFANLFRSLFSLGIASQRVTQAPAWDGASVPHEPRQPTLHPELLDDRGRLINEPLLVMRQISVEDVRDRLDALYEASPENKGGDSEEPPTAPLA